MQRIIWVFIGFLFGAIIFWVPDIILHAIRRRDFSGLDSIALSFLLPIITLTGYKIIGYWGQGALSRVSLVLSMVLGIWVFGPLCLMISATFSGGGFAKPVDWEFIARAIALFPVFTFMMSTYDGTLFAVLFTTLSLGILMFKARASGTR